MPCMTLVYLLTLRYKHGSASNFHAKRTPRAVILYLIPSQIRIMRWRQRFTESFPAATQLA